MVEKYFDAYSSQPAEIVRRSIKKQMATLRDWSGGIDEWAITGKMIENYSEYYIPEIIREVRYCRPVFSKFPYKAYGYGIMASDKEGFFHTCFVTARIFDLDEILFDSKGSYYLFRESVENRIRINNILKKYSSATRIYYCGCSRCGEIYVP